MVEEHADFVELVVELRKLGATHVRSGDLECQLAPVLAAPNLPPVETPAEREKREREERERDLFWSGA